MHQWEDNWRVFLSNSNIKLDDVRGKGGCNCLARHGGHVWTNFFEQ
ncbi:MAG: hypothetical protein H0U27_05260 [Nitrosopumilus sp.]|nr:hypothetical protein [Nitrosopumilus sp.]